MNSIPKVQLPSEITSDKLSTFTDSMRMNSLDNSPEVPSLQGSASSGAPSFQSVLTSVGNELNNTVKAPEQAMQSSMTSNSTDIHDVIIAMSKAELGVNIATSVATKVVQAYEKVMSIQI